MSLLHVGLSRGLRSSSSHDSTPRSLFVDTTSFGARRGEVQTRTNSPQTSVVETSCSGISDFEKVKKKKRTSVVV